MGKFRPRTGGGSSNALCTASAAEILAGYQAITKDSPLPRVGTLSATGNAEASQVLTGKTFYSSNFKNKLTGSMPNRGQAQYAGGFGSGSGYVTFNNIPAGYYGPSAPEIRMDRDTFKSNVINYFGIASVTNFSIAQYSSQKLLFTWANPSWGMWSGIRIVGKQGTYPSNVNDGTVICDSAASSYVSGNLATGTWYFRAWNYITVSGGRWYGDYVQGTGYNSAISGNTTFTGSTTWIVPAAIRSITVFLVGGGGGTYNPATKGNRATGGAGGGYTKTVTISVSPGQVLNINVGGGGTYQGGTSSVYCNGSCLASASGGSGGDNTSQGFAGGSGGGSPRGGGSSSTDARPGKGGSDGSDGGYACTYNSLANIESNIVKGGSGQGYSTKAWGNTGTPYSPGGGGAYYDSDMCKDGTRGAGLTGNNSGAGANGVGNSKWDDAGTAYWNYGSSGIVLFKW